MRAAAFLISLIVLPLAFPAPAQAKDGDDLSGWSVQELCENKDKRRHAEAVFAELERREVFTAVDLARVRGGHFGVGMDEAALQCLWGPPDSESRGDGAVSQTYRNRIDGFRRTIDVRFVAERVTNIRIRLEMDSYPAYPWRPFSERPIDDPYLSPYCSGTGNLC
jgi:hypothetical protein